MNDRLDAGDHRTQRYPAIKLHRHVASPDAGRCAVYTASSGKFALQLLLQPDVAVKARYKKSGSARRGMTCANEASFMTSAPVACCSSSSFRPRLVDHFFALAAIRKAFSRISFKSTLPVFVSKLLIFGGLRQQTWTRNLVAS